MNHPSPSSAFRRLLSLAALFVLLPGLRADISAPGTARPLVEPPAAAPRPVAPPAAAPPPATRGSTPSRPGNTSPQAGQSAGTQTGGQPAAVQEVLVEIKDRTYAHNVSDGLRIGVKVVNRTQHRSEITSINLRLPPSIEVTRDPDAIRKALFKQAPDSNTSESTTEDFGVDANSSRVFYFEIPPAKKTIGLLGLFPNPRWLTITPADYDLQAEVAWNSDEPSGGVAETTARIRIDPDPQALMIGAALGSLLLAVFVFSYRLTEKVSLAELPRLAPPATGLDWPRIKGSGSNFLLHQGSQAITRFWSGTLIAWILLLFLNYAHDIQIPVTIAVNDFFGAVLLGLFTHSLGRWVYEKLFGTIITPTGGPQTKPGPVTPGPTTPSPVTPSPVTPGGQSS